MAAVNPLLLLAPAVGETKPIACGARQKPFIVRRGQPRVVTRERSLSSSRTMIASRRLDGQEYVKLGQEFARHVQPLLALAITGVDSARQQRRCWPGSREGKKYKLAEGPTRSRFARLRYFLRDSARRAMRLKRYALVPDRLRRLRTSFCLESFGAR